MNHPHFSILASFLRENTPEYQQSNQPDESAITELRNESGEVVDNIHSREHCCAKYDFGYNSQRCKTN